VKRILIECQYFPPVAFFTLLQDSQLVYVEKYEHYQKQSYRNRCYINTAGGVEALIIPTIHESTRALIKDVRIDYGQKWVNNHSRAIQSAYGKAPFYEFYRQDVEQLLFKKHPFLFDLNLAILTMCLKWLRYNITTAETTTYEKEPGTGITDFRSVLNPKKPERCNTFFKSVKYHQVFGSKFEHNLSILDLVFCEGPGALDVVRASAVK
jgi:hypothetical protein